MNIEQTKTLTVDEKSKLEKLELVIRTGLQTFSAVGEALQQIQQEKLYKENFDTFEDYLKDVWSIGKTRGYQLIESAKVINNLSTMVDISEKEILTNERQARILSRFEPELQRLIMSDIIEKNLEKNLTAKFLEGFSHAYKIVNDKVKDIKNTIPEFAFDSEKELIEYAKTLIKPEVVEKIIESPELKKQNESLLLNNRDLEVKLKQITQQKQNVLSELEKQKQEISELKKLPETENEFSRQQNNYSDMREYQKFLKVYDKAKENIQELIQIPVLILNDNTKQTVKKQVKDLVDLLDTVRGSLVSSFLFDEVKEIKVNDIYVSYGA